MGNDLEEEIRGMQIALATGLKAYDACSRTQQYNNKGGSAALTRACLSKFASVQLLRLQQEKGLTSSNTSSNNEPNEKQNETNTIPKISKKLIKKAELPPASIELCCWLFQLLFLKFHSTGKNQCIKKWPISI